MALTATNKGAAGNASSTATTVAFTTAGLANGALGVLALSCDNARSGGVAFTTFTCSDNAGGSTNAWELTSGQRLYDPAGTSAGIVGAIFTRPATHPQLLSTSTITVTWDTAVTAKAWTLTEVVGSFGVPTALAGGGGGAGVYNAGAPPSVATAPVSGNLVLCAAHCENTTSSTSTPWVGDADTTNGSWSTIQTIWSGAANTSNVGVGSQYKVVSATGTQTWNPTVSAGGTPDCVLSAVIIGEVATYRASLAWAQLGLPGPFMLGAQAAGSAGLLTPSGSVVLAGVAAVGSITPDSLLGGAPQRAQLAWAELELPPYVGGGVILSQKAGVGAAGALSPLSGVTGAYVAWAQLTLPPSSSVTLTGVAAPGVAYNGLTPIKDAVVVGLTQAAAVGEAGDLDFAITTTLQQAAAVGRIGTLAPLDVNYGYIGQLTPNQSVVLTQAAGVGKITAPGIAGNPDSQAILGPVAAPGVTGLLTPTQSPASALQGVQSLGRAGLLGVAFDYTVALTQQAVAAGSAGVLASEFNNPTYEFLGQAAAVGAAGLLTVEGGVVLSGAAAVGSAGVFDFKEVILIGVKATGSTGRFWFDDTSWTPCPPGGGIWVPVPAGETVWEPV